MGEAVVNYFAAVGIRAHLRTIQSFPYSAPLEDVRLKKQ